MRSIAVVCIIVISVCVISASANTGNVFGADEFQREEGERMKGRDASGSCGKDLQWILSERTNTLTINGTGEMTNYSSSTVVPWHANCSLIKRIVFEGNVSSIGNYSFYECENLSSITIPKSVYYVGNYAFFKCDGLVSVTIPSNATVGNGTFASCNNLTEILFDGINSEFESVDGVLFNRKRTNIVQYPCGKNWTNYTIPATVTIIHPSAFNGCSRLKTISFPSNVTSIGGGAFSGCTGLTSLNLTFDHVSVGSNAFSKCSSLVSTTFTVSKRISVYMNAFMGCSGRVRIISNETSFLLGTCSLSMNVPNLSVSSARITFASASSMYCAINELTLSSDDISFDVLSFGGSKIKMMNITSRNVVFNSYAFLQGEIESLTVSSISSSFKNSTFEKCNLSSVSITSNRTVIDFHAFSNQTTLSSFYIASNETSINSTAFSYCTNLTNFTYQGTNTPVCPDDVFQSSNSLRFVYVFEDYPSNGFCGKSVVLIPNSVRFNQCFDYDVDENGNIIVWKRSDVIDMEKHSNGCVEYKCVNETGIVSHGLCKEGEYVCVGSACVKKDDYLDEGISIEIEFDGIDSADFNTSEFLDILSNLSGVSVDDMKIAVETDEDGRIVSVVVTVNDKNDAKVVVDAINNLDKQKDCEIGILCQSKSASIVTSNRDLSSAVRVTEVFLMLFVIVCVGYL